MRGSALVAALAFAAAATEVMASHSASAARALTAAVRAHALASAAVSLRDGRLA